MPRPECRGSELRPKASEQLLNIMKAYVYILKSIKNGSYYIGSTCNLKKRFSQHNFGNVTATKFKRPYKIVFNQLCDSLSTANKIERKIKNWKRKDFIEKIINDGYIKIKFSCLCSKRGGSSVG